MIKEYVIKLKIELPKERESKMLSDEENLKSIKDLLLEELSSDKYNLDVETFILKNYDAELRNQERQRVIAELEEWVDGYDWWMQDGVIYIVRKDLRQKLKEMKGEKA